MFTLRSWDARKPFLPFEVVVATGYNPFAMTHQKRKGLIFDGDDTLWDNQVFYEEARERAYEIMGGHGGLAEYFESAQIALEDAVQLIEEIDMRNADQMGFISERFSQSMIQTYESLSTKAGLPPDPRASERLWRLGMSVPRRRRSPLAGARETLEALSGDGSHTLVLHSAGDETAQRRKLGQTALEKFFDGRVHVVPVKDDGTLRAVIRAENLDIRSSWMIGNSLRSDINPALRVGLNCIWYHNGGWAYDEAEERESGRIFEIYSLPEAIEIIERERSCGAKGKAAMPDRSPPS
jgi:putative hydrolase of the HAD superfamily